MNPQRIMAYPYSVFIAKQGTEFPSITATEKTIVEQNYTNLFPSTSAAEKTRKWTLLGTAGTKDYSEAGVTVTHSQTIATFQGAGSTWVRKAWRSDEGMQIAFDLADISPQQYARVMDELTVTVVSAGETSEYFTLNRGLEVKGNALFMRGVSSVTEGKFSQYEIPYAYQAGNPSPKFAIKGGPALLSLQFVALEADTSLEGSSVGLYPRLRVGV